MANMVQSEGAVKSYTRRYALTAILRLPSTDLIDSNFNKTNNNNNTDNKNNNINKGTNQSAGQPGKVTPPQLKRYYAIAKDKGFDIDYLDELIKVAYGIQTKNDWIKADYDAFTKYMESNTMQDTHNVLIAKIKKAGKPVPGKK